MGANIPLPALSIRPPAQQDPLATFGQISQIQGMQQQRDLRNQQIQAGQLENTQRQQQLASTQGLIQTIKQANGDPDKVNMQTLVQNNVLPEHADAYMKADYDRRTKLAALDSDTRSTLQAIDEKAASMAQTVRNVDASTPEGQARRQQVYDLGKQTLQSMISSQQSLTPQMKQGAQSMIQQMPAAAPGNDDLDAFIALHNHGAAVTEQVSKQRVSESEAYKNTQQGADAAANAATKSAELPFVAPQAQATLGKTRAETGEVAARTGLAAAETAKTKVETQNLGEQPIFAVDPATNERVMTTRPEAQAKGYTNPVPVKEGDVSKETDARAMINDVQLNKSRYATAMQRVYSEPLTTAQKTALVALTPEKLGMDMGSLFKLELPDVMQKVSNASAFSVLTPAQKQAVVGYYSTLASVPAAQKALTNIGRSNKEMMDLELRTIPTPIMDGGTFNTMLDRFQGNIDQTSRKTVRMPGMPSTSDIRNVYEGGQSQPQAAQNPRNFSGVGVPSGVGLPSMLRPMSTLLGGQQ
jgi:hypothetical protein